MALAIRFDEMLRTGEVSDTIELVRRGHVTQPRMSQIMALNQLAPDIHRRIPSFMKCVARICIGEVKLLMCISRLC